VSGRSIAEGLAGGERALLLAVDDVTARRQAERELVAADRRKNQFLAMLSHELRNPLAAVINAAELLCREMERAQPQARRALQIIGRQTAQMKRLLDDLLDVSRITHGRLELHRQSVELCEAVRSIAAAFAPKLRAQCLALELELPPQPLWLDADPARIEQIIGNLLSNAVKYTPAGGLVTVSAAVTPDGRARLCVQDTRVSASARTRSRASSRSSCRRRPRWTAAGAWASV
jgi:signal transduction histidine kinase